MIIVNADDWGRSTQESDAALDCYRRGLVSSVTAMVFMRDSERAATLARANGIPVGLHLNLWEPFSAKAVPTDLQDDLKAVSRHLSRHRLSPLYFSLRLRSAFRRVVGAQFIEFVRIYGAGPTHIDGHHHQHLCTNVLLQKLIPRGTRIRPSFYFWPGEKGLINRAYRSFVNHALSYRYRSPDYFFALSECGDSTRLNRVMELASTYSVELMVHPAIDPDRSLILSDLFGRRLIELERGGYTDL